MPRDFYPFVEEGADDGQGENHEDQLTVTNPARVAVYDDAAAAPRVVVIEPKGVREYLEEITATVSSLSKEQGGTIPFMVIREIVENFVHAYFQAPTISILDGGNTIRFSDQGPGIREKDRALQYGTSSATEEMKRYIRGVGSGLPYVQQYMRDKGGSLRIEDNIAGGTVVTISTKPADGATADGNAAGETVVGPGAGWPTAGPDAAQVATPGTWAPTQAPWGAQPPYGWQAQPPAGWGQPAGQPYPYQQPYPAQQPYQQTQPYQPSPAVQPPAPAAPQPAAAPVPQIKLSDRGRQALAYALEHDATGPTDLVQAYGSSAATWSRELSALAAQGAVIKTGQKYRPTEFGRTLAGLL